MPYENLCMYCFKELGGSSVCPHCGRDARAAVPQIQMLPGTTVYRDRFLVGRALGQDSNGIVYTAMDTKRGGVIRIREYLPRNCAERLNDGMVVPIAGMEDAFETGMRKLRASVDSVEDPRKRHFYFEENGTAYIAQRKNAGGAAPAEMSYADDDDEDAADHRKQIAIYIAIAAAVVLAVAIGLIWFLNSMSDTDDITLDVPLSTTSPGATWMPAETPTPTPYATATFAALVDPELSWMDYTYTGDVDDDYNSQVQASATQKPTVDTSNDYGTVSSSSSTEKITDLQEHLVRLGWLDYSDVSGRYDSATKQAVKDFQAYVNEYCSPATKLKVDGIAGKKTQQWLYNSNVSLVKPTPTPTPLVTPVPDSAVVDENSPAADIRAVQNKLIALGLLPEGSADGRFGSTTATAVRNFQIRVNQILEYPALEVTGKVDAQTMAYLNYYVEWWEDKHQATATPAPEITTPAPTQSANIDADSAKSDIIRVQELLVDVGLMKASGVDGVYGRGTVAAVKSFQTWVNDTRGERTLEITGVCDPLTVKYLEYCVENGLKAAEPEQAPTQAPTETPTEAPTKAPDPTDDPVYEPGEGEGEGGGSGSVGPDSPVESISFVQEMLSDIGLLDPAGIDGHYGPATKEAVRALQQFVNDQKGEQVLEVTGVCDAQTLEYLMYCYDHGWNLGDQGEPDPTDPPADEPPVIVEPPVEAPTEAPTQAPADDGSITPDSPRETVAYMQDMLAGVGLLESGDVDGVYGAGTAEAIRALQQFVNDQKGERVLEVTGVCDPMTLKYLEFCYEEGWNLSDSGDAPDATEPPYEEPPYEEPPVEEPPVEQPSVGAIHSFGVAVAGMEYSGGVVELNPGRYDITWYAEGELDSYYLYLFDGSRNLLREAEGTDATGFTMDTSSMNPGEVYELRIGALPANGTTDDILWQAVQLMLPVPAEPDPTATPEPEPTPAPEVSKPAINIGSSVYQSEGVTFINDDSVIFSWMAEGAVESYTVNLVYEDGTSFSLGTVSDTSKTVPTAQLQPGMYRLEVGANPIGGGETKWNELYFGIPAPDPTPAPEPDPTEPPAPEEESGPVTYVDAGSSADDIQTVQMALYRFGLIDTDAAQLGALDVPTLEAVSRFQQKVNELYGAGLYVIDPYTDAFVDTETLQYLFDQNLDIRGA